MPARIKLYLLRQTKFWGDYGRILARGLGVKRDKKTGHLLLERAGPYAPPIILKLEPFVGWIALVTQSFREKLEAANFGEVAFKPTIKKHIVDIPWGTWDRHARLPPELPRSGEPEDFILGRKHSKQAAELMEDIWEFMVPTLPCEIRREQHGCHFRYYVTLPETDQRSLFRPRGENQLFFVDEAGRRWFERAADGWVDFDEVTVV